MLQSVSVSAMNEGALGQFHRTTNARGLHQLERFNVLDWLEPDEVGTREWRRRSRPIHMASMISIIRNLSSHIDMDIYSCWRYISYPCDLDIWPSDLRINVCKNPVKCTKFGVGNSFVFVRTNTQRDKVTDATAHPSYASATTDVGHDADASDWRVVGGACRAPAVGIQVAGRRCWHGLPSRRGGEIHAETDALLRQRKESRRQPGLPRNISHVPLSRVTSHLLYHSG